MEFTLALRRALAHYVAHAVLFGLLAAIYFWHSYYIDLLSAKTLLVFQSLLAGYAALGLPYYFLRFRYFISTEEEYQSDKLVLLGKYLRELLAFKLPRLTPTRLAATRTAALAYVVKFFFLPLMFNFFFIHWQEFQFFWRQDFTWNLDYFWQSGRNVIFQLIFIIDTLVFAAAYTFEFSLLRNKIKSVDPYVSGWLVALICYPPFNSALAAFLPLPNDIFLTEGSIYGTLKVLILVFFLIYVWATVALGWKASNLTNRGIIDHGPYAYVRHPAYIAKNIAWWLGLLPLMSWGLAAALIGWNIIYLLRALTEERHLLADPDYRRYCQKVRWRFVPRIV